MKSWRHHDGEKCFGGGWFIVTTRLPTGQVSNHYQLHEAPVLCPSEMNPNGMVPISDKCSNGRWWKAQALIEHLDAHPEVEKVIWADDEVDSFSHDVDTVVSLFPCIQFLILCPRELVGIEEFHMSQISDFLGFQV